MQVKLKVSFERNFYILSQTERQSKLPDEKQGLLTSKISQSSNEDNILRDEHRLDRNNRFLTTSQGISQW